MDYFIFYHQARVSENPAAHDEAWPDLCLADFATWYQAGALRGKGSDADAEDPGGQATSDADSSDDTAGSDDAAGSTGGSSPPASSRATLLTFPLPAKSMRRGGSWVLSRSYKRCKQQRVLRHMQISRDKDPEQHYRGQLLPFVPGSLWVPRIGDAVDEDEALLMGLPDYPECYATHTELVLKHSEPYVYDREVDWEQLVAAAAAELAEAHARVAEQERTQPQPDSAAGDCQYDIGPDMQGEARRTDAAGGAAAVAPAVYCRLLAGGQRLNPRQRALYNHVLFTAMHSPDTPFHIFLTGGAGVGKSVLVRAIMQGLMRWYDTPLAAPLGSITVAVAAQTALAAFNVGGDTIHGTLGFGTGTGYAPTPRPSAESLNALQVRFRGLKLLIIDEISLVSNVLPR